MRHIIWMKFLKDFEFDLLYHLGEANVVVDALIKKKNSCILYDGQEFRFDQREAIVRYWALEDKDVKLKRLILEEGHQIHFSMHSSMTKMYQDLKESFWWPRRKRHVAKFVAACLTYQRTKVEHQRLGGLMQ
ncbi:uncharacterized protein LOC124825371 [Vigna umbellata]|uniref:uncharacterized protein LOC124825371 n=1 Tax=Vigna umbellata TaxID=87088 RepID=UPI001F5F653D|nr:uncharacterized protein LOC124825371 [Vigna umbellata]